MVLTSAGSALTAEAQQRANRMVTASQVGVAPAPAPTSRAGNSGAGSLAERALVAGGELRCKSRGNLLADRFRVERQKTPFVAQTRVPVAHLWAGRIEIGYVQQRMREVHSGSAVPQPEQAMVLRPDRIPYLQPESRTSYGGGIWLTFGRPRGTVRKAA
jgi:hypothetical protein